MTVLLTVRAKRAHLWATMASYVFMTIMGLVFYLAYQDYRQLMQRHPLSPHAIHTDDQQLHCNDCHQPSVGSKCYRDRFYMRHTNCLKCHDHEDQGLDTLGMASVVLLCTKCHPPGGFVRYALPTGQVAEISMALTHPVGLKPTPDVYPRSLPLGEQGEVHCTTCHDPHALMTSSKMLRSPVSSRLHQPQSLNGFCVDCHHKDLRVANPEDKT